MQQSTLSSEAQVLDQLKVHLTDVTCNKSSAISFVKGFVLGQLFVIVIVILVLKYLFTEDVKRVNKVRFSAYTFYFDPSSQLNYGDFISDISRPDYPPHHPLESMQRYLYPTIISLRKHIMT